MKLVAIDDCIVNRRTDMLHHSLYHGTSERDDTQPNYLAWHRIGDDLSHPMKVMVGGNPLHRFFKPCSSIVLSSHVKTVLGDLPNVQYLPVKFTQVVGMSVSAGDFSIPRQTLDLQWIPTFLRSMPDLPQLHPREPFYELVVTNPYRSDNFDTLSSKVSVTLPNIVSPVFDISYTTKLIDECPVFWSSETVFHRDVFDKIESMGLLDPDYFTWCEFEV